MEFLSKIVEYPIELVGRLLGRQVGYVIHCRTNIQKLQDQVKELKAARETIKEKVAEAETKGKKIRPDVELWLTTVDEITAKTDKWLNDESQAELKCLHGFCPNVTVRHRLSRNSTKLAQELVEHHGKGRLISEVSGGLHRKEVWDVTTRDYQALESRMLIVKKIMDSLNDSDIQRIGVFGFGGVGKTTLVIEVYKQASVDKNLFDNVIILLDVKSNPDPEAIQKKIVEKLGMEILSTETKEGRATRLCAKIQGKKILLILDDVQEKIELEDLGVPRLPTCKILLTCRTREVLSPDMQANKVFQLDLLGKEETWSLFMRMAGDVVEQNGRVRDVAIQIAQKCGGLPLLVIAVASALKEKENLQAWKDALRRLKSFDKEVLTTKAYLALKWSYDQLDDRELKPIFLLCGMLVMQKDICLQDVLKYGMGLGLFKNISTVEEAQNSMHTLIDKLKDSCLLLDGETEGWVRMHDLVCDVASWIAHRDQYILSVGYGGELKEWPGEDFLKNCTKISLRSSNIPTLSEIPLECPNLEMFYLNGKDDSVVIPSNFFSEMRKLKVLDLTNMCMLSLPSSLQYLKTLQTLCLDQCTLGDITLLGQLSSLEILSLLKSNVKELPREIGQLTRLRLLDLSRCSGLEVISPTVLSRLVRLEDLRMRNSFNKWAVEGENSNASLSELKHLSQLSALEIDIPNANILPANLFSRKLERYYISIGDVWDGSYLYSKTTPNTLKLKLTNNNIKGLDEGLKSLLKRSEDLSLDESNQSIVNIVQQLDAKDLENVKHLRLQNLFASTDIINRKVVFHNLATLWVHGCDNLKVLFSFYTAKSLVLLKHLNVSACKLLQEIVSSTREGGEDNIDDMFPKLEVLKLEALPNLARFSTGNYIEFPSLEELEVECCFNPGVFIGDKVSMSSEDTRRCKEDEQMVLEEEENLEVKSESVVKYSLFNEKVVFPKLATLSVHGCDHLKFLFSFSMDKSLIQLTYLEISVCKLLQEIVSSTREGGEDNMDDMFFKLKVLKLEELPNLARFSTGNYIEFPSLEELEISGCDNLGAIIGDKVSMSSKDTRSFKEIEQRVLEEEENIEVKSETVVKYSLFDKKVEFPNLATLSVHGCDNLKFLSSSSMAKSLEQLTHLEISACKLLQEIVSLTREGGEDNMKDMFSKLEVLKLEELPNLARFSTENYIEFRSLEELEVNGCDNIGVFIGDKVSMSNKDTRSCKEIEQRVLEVKSESVVKYSLFNEKVGFPMLERLIIKGIRELKAIWHVQLSQNSFWRLKQLEVQQCDNLISLFLPSVMGRLNALEILRIQNCKSLEVVFEEIVGAKEEQEVAETTPPQFVLPKVTSVQLKNLPQLTGCINASRLPSLKRLEVEGCDKVGIFATEFSHFRKKYEMEPLMTSQKPLFLTNKDSFLDLEHLPLFGMEIWDGPPPADQLVFGKLKSICFYGNCAPFSKQASVLFLQRLQNLEEIQMRDNSYERLSGCTTREEIHDDAVGSGTLPRVRSLTLFRMDQLMDLENDNSQSLLFPNLETLQLWFCSRLKSIESSAISFRNLTTLKVWFCEGFEYITSYSVAKSLVQLKTLEVAICRSVVVIVASNVGDDDADDAPGNEIVFSHLQHLSLGNLPRLQGFSSENCTVKFPSSVTVKVYECPIKLKISPDGVLLTVIEDQCEQKGDDDIDNDDDDQQKNDVESARRTPKISSEEPAL